jgi:hypothetical protein
MGVRRDPGAHGRDGVREVDRAVGARSLGGATASGGAPVALDGTDGTVHFQQVKTPSVAGTFGGIGTVVGSNEPSGSTTEVEL